MVIVCQPANYYHNGSLCQSKEITQLVQGHFYKSITGHLLPSLPFFLYLPNHACTITKVICLTCWQMHLALYNIVNRQPISEYGQSISNCHLPPQLTILMMR
jgi:hypothetical protein